MKDSGLMRRFHRMIIKDLHPAFASEDNAERTCVRFLSVSDGCTFVHRSPRSSSVSSLVHPLQNRLVQNNESTQHVSHRRKICQSNCLNLHLLAPSITKMNDKSATVPSMVSPKYLVYDASSSVKQRLSLRLASPHPLRFAQQENIVNFFSSAR